MNRNNYIILLLVLIVIYIIFFTKNTFVHNILNNVKSIMSKKENYNNELPMKHSNFIYNHVDAIKNKFQQPGREFTGYFTKITN